MPSAAEAASSQSFMLSANKGQKLKPRKENAILEIENKLKQKNLIMYQVGDKTQERSIISSDVRT